MSEKRDFNQVAAAWDDNPRRRQLAAAVADGIVDQLPLNRTLQALEYGCGTGLVGLQLAAGLGHLTAADSSPGMLQVLQEKCAALGLENVTPLAVADDSWTLPDAGFDLLISSMVLHHIADTEALLRHFHAALKTGGCIALADLEQEDGSFHEDPTGIAHHGFDPRVLVEMLRRLGFAELQQRTVYVIRKPQGEVEKTYPVFLLTGRKLSDWNVALRPGSIWQERSR
jgi:ubiquinone/menaquinone biosynthesis C-methylase UbiE